MPFVVPAFRAFFHKTPLEERKRLSRFLPADEQTSAEKETSSFGDATKGIAPIAERIKRMHPSWLAPILRARSERDIALFLSSLSPEQEEPLRMSLRLAGGKIPLEPMAAAFLQQELYTALIQGEPNLLPEELLPESPANELLRFSLQNLRELIFFLGLHDLAIEVRQIIDRPRLTRIYGALEKEEKHYLDILLQSREPITFSSMRLLGWQGDREQLRSLLLHRGLNRLAKAIYGESPSLIWHILHRLDIDEAVVMKRALGPLDSASQVRLLKAQIDELVSFLGRIHG